MFGVSHGALQFMTYEEMKNRYNIYKKVPIDTKLVRTRSLFDYSLKFFFHSFNSFQTSYEYLMFAAISKFIAAGTTYPYQVVRARLQDHHHNYSGVWHCVKDTWRYERFRGFYKGLCPYLLHVTPNICLVMLIWEKFTNKGPND